MNLTVTTPSDREIEMTRVFNAPAHLVYRALTEPSLLKRWCLGPDGWEMILCEMDLRVGGAYRHRWRSIAEGAEFGFRGKFLEIVPNVRLVATEVFEDFGQPVPDLSQADLEAGAGINTSVLTEGADGKTTLTLTCLYPSREVRDLVLQTGMEHGVEASYNRLEELLRSS